VTRVVGIDPGTQHLGWGVLDVRGNTLTHVASGTLHAPKSGPQAGLVSRLCYLADALDALIATHRPEAGAVETIFHAKNSQSALKLGHARGVALLCLGRAGVPVFEYTAGQIKQAATGRGRAEKEQVQAMVRLLLRLTVEGLELDTTDALAAAICHAQHGNSLVSRLAPPAPRRTAEGRRR
jgi:crossover junction endodeoxyribonuclease RuvC